MGIHVWLKKNLFRFGREAANNYLDKHKCGYR